MQDAEVRMMMTQIALEAIQLGRDVSIDQRDYHDVRNVVGAMSSVKTDDTGISLRVFSLESGEDEMEEDGEEE